MSYVSDQGVLNAQFNTEIVRCLPHVLMRPALIQDGNAWLAIYGDLPTGVVGTGATPAEAMADFDAAWNRPAVTPPGYGLKRPADTALTAKDADRSMTPRPNCPASQFGCSCGNGPCAADPFGHLLVKHSRLNLWLAIGAAAFFCSWVVIGYFSLERVAKAHQIEARV